MERLTYYNERKGHYDWHCTNHEVADRLAAYEDAEEQGLLVRLPCKVGDKVYLTIGSKKKIHEAIAGIFYIDQMGLEVEAIYNHFGLMCFCGRLGVNVFATREEAEAAPKEG